MPLTPGSRLGPYEIIARLGAGGMGEVWSATDTNLRRQVAIKVLPDTFAQDPERLARFEREARALASLNHANIATIHGWEKTDGIRALVMELVEGPTLADCIAEGPIHATKSLAIARQIAEALEAAHDQGIVHRDLKPANIKVRPDGSVKVLDFGLAKLTDTADVNADATLHSTETSPVQMTGVGVVLGTPAYMSPEQVMGKPADRRADVWAFGVVVYEMITGERPFRGHSTPELSAAILRHDPSLEALPYHLRPVIARCLEKDPRHRWSSIADVRLLLDDSMNAARSLPRAAAASRLPWLVAALLLIALLSVGALYLTGRVTSPQTVRFSIPVPGGDGPSSMLALSPDGAQLAISAVQDGRRNLFVRRIDSLSARLIPDTEGALYPFWSPESDQVGFVAERKLKKVSAGGGPVIPLVDDVGTMQGASWSERGAILFARGGSLWTVDQEGGTPVRLIESTGLSLPHFLPGGQTFLFTRTDATAGHSNQGVHAGFINGEASVRLLEDRVKAEYVRPLYDRGPGRLVFRRDGLLMAQPFDADRLALTGSAVPVTPEAVISVTGFGPTVLFSASQTGVLAYQPVTQDQLVWVDRTGAVQERVGPPGEYRSFRLSPNRNRIAMDINIYGNGASTAEVATLDLRRGVVERVTDDGEADLVPVWAPDSTRLAFASLRLGGFQPFVADGEVQKHLAAMVPGGGWPSDWSPDGRFVLWIGNGIWAIPLAEGEMPVQYLSPGFQPRYARFSPDGRWVAYSSTDSGREEVYLRRFPSGRRFPVSANGGHAPAWRNDGRELFYIAGDGRMTAVSVSLGDTSVEFGRSEALFVARAGQFSRDYEVSDDGQRFLVTRPVNPGGASATVVLNWQTELER